jgi:putative endonuclease
LIAAYREEESQIITNRGAESMQQSGKRDVALQNKAGVARPNRKQTAAEGEDIAAQHLSRLGLRLLCRNWHSGRFGEIDLIFEDATGLLVFVEVKTRLRRVKSIHEQGDAFNAIDWRKRRQLLICAQSYMSYTRRGNGGYRMDAVLISHTQASLHAHNKVQLQDVMLMHIANAFTDI